jgi:LCP family protein required for cell wall assembly
MVGPPRRRWPRRILIALNVLVAFSLVATAGAYGYMKFRLGQVPRLSIAGLRNAGDDDPNEPMNVLVVGSDSRKNISKTEAQAFGSERQVGGERSDTIIVLHVDPNAEKAALLSIPRDLFVPIAGTTRSDKINSAFRAGPDRLIATIKGALGIEIDHYVQVDFNGFRGIVDAIGGVKVYFAAPARDRQTGLNIPAAGCVKLDGNQALQYVRSREYQYYESGRWRIDGSADLGRIDRQQDFIRRVMHRAVRVGRNPARLNSLIASSVDTVKMDHAFSTKDMLRLATKFRSMSPETVDMIDIPTFGGRVNGASVLRMKQPDADEVLARFRGELVSDGDQPTSAPRILPSTVRVRVLNGTGTSGQAGQAATGLRRAGFQLSGTPGDADDFTYSRTLVRYGTGQRDKARLLQSYVLGGARLQEDPTIRGVDLVLVTGSSFAGVKAPATTSRESAGTTASTARPAPTTARPTPTTQPQSKGAPAEAVC